MCCIAEVPTAIGGQRGGGDWVIGFGIFSKSKKVSGIIGTIIRKLHNFLVIASNYKCNYKCNYKGYNVINVLFPIVLLPYYL